VGDAGGELGGFAVADALGAVGDGEPDGDGVGDGDDDEEGEPSEVVVEDAAVVGAAGDGATVAPLLGVGVGVVVPVGELDGVAVWVASAVGSTPTMVRIWASNCESVPWISESGTSLRCAPYFMI
jgi:hypothetical protein